MTMTLMMPPKPRRSKPKPAIRAERRRKIRRIREAIEAGDYENTLKLTIAIDRLLEALQRPPRP